MQDTKALQKFKLALTEQAKKTGTPIYAVFELTGRCNLDCKMCYVHVMDHKEALKKELSKEQWLKIFDDAFAEGMMFALLTGGECLIRPDFKELYLYLWNRGVKVSVNTNGVFLNEDYVEFFRHYPPEQIQISLYGSNEDSYEKVTGSRVFARVDHAITLLQEASIPLTMAVTPNRYMLEDVDGLMTYFRDRNLEHDISPFLIEPREGIVRDNYALSQEEYISFLLKRQRYIGKVVEAPTQIPEAGGTCTEPVQGMRCKAGTVRSLITWDGYMVPCMALMDIRENVLELGYQECWKRINAAAKRAFLPMECEGCIYEKMCSICPAVRSGRMSSEHCKKSQCDRMKQLYAAGVFSLPTKK